jgi:hypothetical protein
MNRQSQLIEVLVAAEAVLEARQNQMLTQVEWDGLAKSVAAARAPDPTAADTQTYAGLLEVWNQACYDAAEAALRSAGVKFDRHDAAQPWFDVAAITAGQYAAVLNALHAAGEPGVDWNFPLD